MNDPQSKSEIIASLQQVQQGVSATVQTLPTTLFYQGSAEVWSPCDYLKHLLLSVKPFAKAINFPPAALKRRFGESNHPSRSYAELVARYQARLDDGIRAEDYDTVMPTTFRLPEEVADVQAYLVGVWNEAYERMIAGLTQWSEADLDTVQILHPAIGSITVREMLFFTIYHSTLHWNDIRRVGTTA